MKIKYLSKNNLEKFGQEIYFLLVENFPETYFVGGTVRDILLKKEVKDIDIATSAKPEEVAEVLKSHYINFNLGYKNLGIVIATSNNFSVTIASFRTEVYRTSRYPKISLTKEVKLDSKRRDFTINALYLSPKLNKVLDFHNGLRDLKNNKIRFIGDPEKRIKEDPLRILRAIRFAINLNFKLTSETIKAIKNNFQSLKTISKNKCVMEISKIKNKNARNLVNQGLLGEKTLDKFFKKL